MNSDDIEIHPTAIIHDGAKIGPGCEIGPYSIVGSLAQIGARTKIGAFCEIGLHSGTLPMAPLVIGTDSLIRSGSVLYAASEIGEKLRTGHKVTSREGLKAGKDLQVGTLSDIQGHCKIGDHVRFHSNVHVGQRSTIGNCVWIFPYVVLTNDPHPPSDILEGCVISDFAVVATMSTVLPGKIVHEGALVGAMTLVRDDVPPDTICVGVPGKIVGSTRKIRFKESGMPVYPWRRHFHRGYPVDLVAKWKEEFSEA